MEFDKLAHTSNTHIEVQEPVHGKVAYIPETHEYNIRFKAN